MFIRIAALGILGISAKICDVLRITRRSCVFLGMQASGKTTLLDCRIEELLLKYDDCGCVKDDLFKNTIIDIDILLKSARAEVNICNVEKATLKFRKAIKMVDFLDKQLNCK